MSKITKKTLLGLVAVLCLCTGCGALSKALSDAVASSTSQYLTTISGTITLGGASSHEGITVSLYKQTSSTSSLESSSLSALSSSPVATTSTSTDGSFSISGSMISTSGLKSESVELSTGYYTAVYTKDGYISTSQNNVLLTVGSGSYILNTSTLKPKIELTYSSNSVDTSYNYLKVIYSPSSSISYYSGTYIMYYSYDGISYTYWGTGYSNGTSGKYLYGAIPNYDSTKKTTYYFRWYNDADLVAEASFTKS